MKTMDEIDAWYEAQMNQARLKGEQLGEQRQQQAIAAIALNLIRENVPLEVVSRTTGLTIAQLQLNNIDRTRSIETIEMMVVGLPTAMGDRIYFGGR
jgi:RNase H-fold protein (predicted Holliday junction resolvase)